MTSASLPGIHKIAVLRANALGDYLFAVPALTALRETYPQVEIVLLGLQWHKDVLEGRPGPVDRVVVVPPYPGVRDKGEMNADEQEQFFAAMQDERFDLAVQIHGGGRNSNPFLHRLGARVNIGLCTPDAPRLDLWVPYVYYQSEIMRYLEVVALVGAKTGEIEPRFVLTERDIAEAQAAFPEHRQLVVLHPGATDSRRRWPIEKFAEVGDALASEGMTIAVSGVGSERELVEGVIGAMQAPAINLCDRLSIGGYAALLARSRLVISNDSGPFHLAGAVDTPAVGIYWCSNVITATEHFRAHRRLAISWRVHCPVCDAPLLHSDFADASCNHRDSVVAEVPVTEVLGYARELLAQYPARAV